MNLSLLVPFFDSSVREWSLSARLLRWLTFLWLFVGLVVLFSASYPNGDGNYSDGLYYFKRQIIWVLIALVIFNLVVRFPLRHVLGMASGFMIILLSLIFLTL